MEIPFASESMLSSCGDVANEIGLGRIARLCVTGCAITTVAKKGSTIKYPRADVASRAGGA
jgi:hypothetical protein